MISNIKLRGAESVGKDAYMQTNKQTKQTNNLIGLNPYFQSKLLFCALLQPCRIAREKK